jgi:hypothetical protein
VLIMEGEWGIHYSELENAGAFKSLGTVLGEISQYGVSYQTLHQFIVPP